MSAYHRVSALKRGRSDEQSVVETVFLGQIVGFAEETCGFLLLPRGFFVPLWHENVKELKE